MEEIEENIKEISPGIWLYKENEDYPKDPAASKLSIWNIEVTTMTVIECIADFQESENIKLENNSKEHKTITEINPFEKKEIARIIIYPNGVVKTKFTLTLKVPSISVQEAYMKNEIIINEQLLAQCKNVLSSHNFECLPQNEIEKIFSDNKINKFVDFEFPPCNNSFIAEYYHSTFLEDFGYLINWRRPENFVLLTNDKNNHMNVKLINNQPEPNDIHKEQLNDNYLISALSGIAEKDNLVKRLFKSSSTSPHGIYSIYLWINGQPKTIIIDDLFPCLPRGNPIVTRSPSNEIWVLLLEKALAKVTGSYFSLQELTVEDSLLMLTGCPTFCYPIASFEGEDGKNDLVMKLKSCLDRKYLVIAMERKNESEDGNEESGSLILPNFGYNILGLTQQNKYTFIQLRKAWFNKEVEDRVLEYHKQYTTLFPELKGEIEDGKMVMTVDDFVKVFNVFTVCYTESWEETRIRGKFIFGRETSTSKTEICLSKWYYCFTLDSPTQIIISLFQEEDKIKNSDSRKQIMDISLSILNYDAMSNEISHRETIDFAHSSSIQQDVELPKGTYIIYPRTSGCFMGRPFDIKTVEKTPLYDYNTKKLSSVFIEVIKDIFKKFNLQEYETLSYSEFKGFHEVATKTTIDESTFKNKILKNFSNYKNELTERGFIQFFEDAYLNKGEPVIREWLKNLEYTEDLYCNKSRCFNLVIHSKKPIVLSARDSFNSEINSKVNNILLKNFGELKENKKKGSIVPILIQSKLNGVFSLGCKNVSRQDMNVKLSIANSNEILTSTKHEVEKIVKGGDCEYFFQFYSFYQDRVDDIEYNINASPIY